MVKLHRASASGRNLACLSEVAAAAQCSYSLADCYFAEPRGRRKLRSGGLAALMHGMQNPLLCRRHITESF